MQNNKKDTIRVREHSYLSFDNDLGHYVLVNEQDFHDVIILSVPSFLRLERELFRLFGAAAPSLLQIAGEAAGGQSAKRLSRVENMEDDIRSAFNSVSRWGFGRYELIDLNLARGYIKFKLHNNPLAIPCDEGSSGLIDQAAISSHNFLIGFYKGYFHTLFKELVFCKETRCMNRGDAFCEFEVWKMTPESHH
jgi:predicted hydrocarbon binding protein